MTANQTVQWICIAVLAVMLTAAIYQTYQLGRFVKRKTSRKEIYSIISDPKLVEDEGLREVSEAPLTRPLPREDAGPPAKVYRPPLRNVIHGSWRPRNPGTFEYNERLDN